MLCPWLDEWRGDHIIETRFFQGWETSVFIGKRMWHLGGVWIGGALFPQYIRVWGAGTLVNTIVTNGPCLCNWPDGATTMLDFCQFTQHRLLELLSYLALIASLSYLGLATNQRRDMHARQLGRVTWFALRLRFTAIMLQLTR